MQLLLDEGTLNAMLLPPCVVARDLVKTVDLTKPHQWYPMARALQRRIIYHAGPTNSGKTYSALQVTLCVLDIQAAEQMSRASILAALRPGGLVQHRVFAASTAASFLFFNRSPAFRGDAMLLR